MHHFFEAITNTAGDSLIGYFGRVINRTTQNTVTLSSDENGTPIVVTSGVENMAKTDDYGNLSLYVEPGTYHLDIYAPNTTTFLYRVSDIAMNSTKGDTGAPGAQGEVGESDATFTTLAALKAINPTVYPSPRLAAVSGSDGGVVNGLFTYQTGNFTGRTDVVQVNGIALTTGALVRQQASSITSNRGTTGAVTRPAEVAIREISRPITAFGGVGDGSTLNDAAFMRAATELSGAVTAGVSVEITLPAGTYNTNFIGAQGLSIRGESRLGTVIRCISGGSAAVIDARFNRDGATPNTQGQLNVRDLSVNVNGQSRNGICAYGGSCMIDNVEVYGSAAHGINLQYVLMTTLRNVTTRNNALDGVYIDVDAIHASDVNTSINALNVWSLFNGRNGFYAQNITYCKFDNCCSQGNAGDGWKIDGGAGGVNSASAMDFINCASEVDSGTAFNFRKLRSFTLMDPFVIPNPSQNTIKLDDCIGLLHGFVDSSTHTGGTQSLKFISSTGLGLMRVHGGDFKMDDAERKFCSFDTTNVNNVIRNSANNLTFNDATDVQKVTARTTAFGGDFSGLGFFAEDGTRMGFFSRTGGVVLPSGRGALGDTSAMVNGDIYPYAGTTALTFVVKGTDGVVRTGTITLA